MSAPTEIPPRPTPVGPRASTLDLRGLSGLTEAEARTRLAEEGPNELPASRSGAACSPSPSRSSASRCSCCWSPAAALYLLMGEPSDALMLLGFVFVVMGITIVQERRTERALEALRDLSSPRALVIRDGAAAAHRRPRGGARRHRRPRRGRPRAGRCACCGAAINLSRRRVAAHRRIGAGAQGAVGRRARRSTARAATTCPLVFSGTLVTAGQGIAEVLATGAAHRARQDRQGARSRSSPSRRRCRRRPGGWCAPSPSSASPPAPSWWSSTPSPAAAPAQVWKEGLLAGITMAMAIAAGGVPGGAHDLPGAGRLADLAQPRADAPHAGHRDARRGHRAVRRQDRHADPEPDDAAAAGRRRPRPSTSAPAPPTLPGGVPRAARVRHPGQQARSVRPDGAGPRRRPGDRLLDAHRAPAPRVDAGARVPALAASCWPSARSGSSASGDDARRRRQGRARRRSPTCATCRRSGARRIAAEAAALAGGRAARARRGPRPDAGGRACPASTARSRTSSSSAWSAWRIRCAPTVPAAVAECRTRRHPRGDDHRRLPGHRAEHRPPGRPRRPASRSSPARSSTR